MKPSTGQGAGMLLPAQPEHTEHLPGAEGFRRAVAIRETGIKEIDNIMKV